MHAVFTSTAIIVRRHIDIAIWSPIIIYCHASRCHKYLSDFIDYYTLHLRHMPPKRLAAALDMADYREPIFTHISPPHLGLFYINTSSLHHFPYALCICLISLVCLYFYATIGIIINIYLHLSYIICRLSSTCSLHTTLLFQWWLRHVLKGDDYFASKIRFPLLMLSLSAHLSR